MAGSKTDFHEDAVLNTARGTTLTNGETSSVTEVSGNNYARQSVTFGAPSSGAMTNSGLITFPTPSGSWGTPTGLIVADAVSAGNIRYYSDLSNSPGAIASGNTVTIAIGALSVSEG
jgi:hypothetical protein